MCLLGCEREKALYAAHAVHAMSILVSGSPFIRLSGGLCGHRSLGSTARPAVGSSERPRKHFTHIPPFSAAHTPFGVLYSPIPNYKSFQTGKRAGLCLTALRCTTHSVLRLVRFAGASRNVSNAYFDVAGLQLMREGGRHVQDKGIGWQRHWLPPRRTCRTASAACQPVTHTPFMFQE